MAEVPHHHASNDMDIDSQIDAICDRFELAWQKESWPQPLAYLQQLDTKAEPTDQVQLAKYLIEIDVEYRIRHDQRPGPNDYRWYLDIAGSNKGEDLNALVDASINKIAPTGLESQLVTEELAAASNDSTQIPESRKRINSPGQLDSLCGQSLGQFHLVKELGRGGMGVVFEAQHIELRHRVAIKLLPAVDGSRLHRFKREFRSLADINHPNLIGLQTLESDGQHWFMTMDLMEGAKDFRSYVRPDGKLDHHRLRSTLPQLVAGLTALHGLQIVHCDIKPSNVLIDQNDRLKLLDFGLVSELDRRGLTLTQDQLAGTPAYMAPEQAAGKTATPASDWYAVGVMLYEVLSGHLPFSGSMLQVLQQKQHEDPPPLPQDESASEGLRSLCMRLLDRDPAKRPDYLEAGRWTTSSPAPATKLEEPEEGVFIGREQQLAALEEAYQWLQKNRKPLTVFISGRSGEGKSSLWRRFMATKQQQTEFALMAGRCYDRESVPFKALDTLVDALATYLRSLPTEQAALLMPRDMSVLAHVFPTLQRVGVVGQVPGIDLAELDQQQVRQRAFGALRELLLRLSDRTPVVWFIDDLQWGDADSAEALYQVLRPPDAPRVWFVGTYRSDELENSQFLKKWEQLQQQQHPNVDRRDIQVGPLSINQCLQVMQSSLGLKSEQFIQRARQLAEDVGGNPLLLVELLDCFDAESRTLRSLPLHELISTKLQQLPEDAATLLDVIATSGQAIAWEEAFQAAKCTSNAPSTLTHMRNERLVRLVGSEESPKVDTYHDKIRESVLDRMDHRVKRALHLALGEAIEQNQQIQFENLQQQCLHGKNDRPAQVIPRVYDLAYHFDASGQVDKALVYALLAAEQARRQFALEVSTEQYAIAERNAKEASDAIRFRIAEGYGETLMLQGNYGAAATRADRALELADNPLHEARIEAILGEIAFKSGELNRSIAAYESGLRRLGNRIPKRWWGYAAGAVGQAFIQTGHSLFPARLHRRTPTEQEVLSNQLFSRLTNSYMMQNVLKTLWAMLSGMNRAEQYPPSRELAFNYALNAYLTLIGWNSRALSYVDRSVEIRSNFNDIWGMGHSHSWRGIGLYASGEFEAAIPSLLKAIEAFSQTGDQWELNLARFHLAFCYYRLGKLQEAVKHASTTFHSSLNIGDTRTHCSLFLWSRCVKGNLPFEELTEKFQAVPEEIMPMSNLLIGQGRWHLFHGRTQQAIDAFQQAWRLSRANLSVNFHTVPQSTACRQ